MTTHTIHLGIVPIDPANWDPHPHGLGLSLFEQELMAHGADADSFVTWGEKVQDDEPHRITFYAHLIHQDDEDEDPEPLDRRDLWLVVKDVMVALAGAIPADWRVLDYAVVTDPDDHSKDAVTVGKWDFA